MTGGDLDAASRVECTDGETNGRRCGDAKVMDFATGSGESGENGVSQHSPAGPAVATEDDFAAVEMLAKRRRELQRYLRRQTVADDAAHAGDTDDEIAVGWHEPSFVAERGSSAAESHFMTGATVTRDERRRFPGF